MATALVPLIAGIAPEIINLITGLIHKSAPAAEQSLGPKTGPLKFLQVFSDVMGALTDLANKGVIPKALPSDDTVKAIIQAVVTSLQLTGALTDTPLASATAQAITLKAGQSVTITVAA